MRSPMGSTATSSTTTFPFERRPFELTLRPLPGTDAILSLRRILKFALRQCGMRCVNIREINLEE